MPHVLCIRTILAAVLSLSTASIAQATPAEIEPMVPRLDGDWIKLVGRPPLERWQSPKAEPVDFTCFQADDGTWQLIACIRFTTHPGEGRLLYRWSSPKLTATGWHGEGIFLQSDLALHHAEGVLQAPFHAREDGTHYLFYNSRGAHLMTSEDGKTYAPYGTTPLFSMGRDLCLLDDRAQSGNWIAFYTSPEPGINPATRDHTIRARTAPHLTGPWSAPDVEIPPLSPPSPGYTFVYAESPLVIRRSGYFYRFEQMNVFRSTDPFVWSNPPVTCLLPKNPIRLLAPEIVTCDDRDYLLAYQWLNDDERGIFLAPLAWEKVRE